MTMINNHSVLTLSPIGGIAYASFINDRFDEDPKKWRFVAALALDVAILIEICTPIFPEHFLMMAALANIGPCTLFGDMILQD